MYGDVGVSLLESDLRRVIENLTCTNSHALCLAIASRIIAVLSSKLEDVSQADGAVSLEYLRGHVQRLDEAVAKAGQIGLRDALFDSAVAELESLKLMLRHAECMQNYIDNNPLKGCGAGMKGVYVQFICWTFGGFSGVCLFYTLRM